ncbi:MAG: aminoacyl--tRNA ligase-related protein [Candidatus Yanofskybacteria bacterium]|nr:aminoacyl--tRNA ligase-related protein [Candidatus Yanofskybacteria bacterium]
MRQSFLFTATRREAPKDEESTNAKLLIRGGFLHKEMAGAYAFLPLGLRVLENIKRIIREEMNALGAQEILMTTLQRKELWETTNRWDDKEVDVWFKSTLHAGGEVGFGWSHEEPIADMLKSHVESFRDLPVYVHQFQPKLRNELRAKSGIMRGREFLMNDMYSFDSSEEHHTAFYNQAIKAYERVFERAGIGEDTFMTFASGGAFTKFSHEFQTIIDAGEDKIYLNHEKRIAINEEVLNEVVLQELGIRRDELVEVKTAEVGNIFNFGTAKCEQLGLLFTNEAGKRVPAWLGSYGIGVTRLMGVIVEKHHDEKGIIWPSSVAPFRMHLVALPGGETIAEKLYGDLQSKGTDVLYDDRVSASPGEKLMDADLLGIPLRVVVSERTLKEDGVEIKKRTEADSQIIKIHDLLAYEVI